MQPPSLRLVMIFACAAHAWFHVLVALFLTIVLVLEPAWQRPYDELIGLWTVGALLLGLGDGLLGIGALVTGVYLLGATAQLLGGHFADRGAAKRVYVLSYGLKLAALLLALTVSGWPVVAAAVAIVFVFDLTAPVENVLIARFTSSRRRGLAYGLRNGIAIAAGPLGVQLVAWLFDDVTGFDPVLLVLAAMVLAILVAACLLPSDRAQAAPAQA